MTYRHGLGEAHYLHSESLANVMLLCPQQLPVKQEKFWKIKLLVQLETALDVWGWEGVGQPGID